MEQKKAFQNEDNDEEEEEEEEEEDSPLKLREILESQHGESKNFIFREVSIALQKVNLTK